MRKFKPFYLLILILIQAKSFAWMWRDLWSTADQQGEVLMQKQKFKEASAKFENPAWRGFAAYRAGDYKTALESFAAVPSELGFYNQGNALAKLGRFEQAIAAYDKALKINPKNADALYNRRLLEELQKSKQEQQQNSDKSNQNSDSSKDNSSGSKQDKAEKPEGSKEAKKEQQNSNAKNNNEPAKRESKPKQDSNLKADKSQEGQENSEISEKEKQQAKQQWLRLIPDDPGGLLREKFLRDYIRKQQGWYR